MLCDQAQVCWGTGEVHRYDDMVTVWQHSYMVGHGAAWYAGWRGRMWWFRSCGVVIGMVCQCKLSWGDIPVNRMLGMTVGLMLWCSAGEGTLRNGDEQAWWRGVLQAIGYGL